MIDLTPVYDALQSFGKSCWLDSVRGDLHIGQKKVGFIDLNDFGIVVYTQDDLMHKHLKKRKIRSCKIS